MSLGEKLRQARMETGLSQRQLCGDEITRNMLSQIEHDTARPSMSTLQYLAGRLGLPVSYFLEEETAVSANLRCMELAWLQLGAGDYDAALRQLEEYRSPDSVCDREHALLLSLLYLNLAEQSIANQKTVYARQLLERAAELEPEHPWLPELKNRRMLLLGRLGEMPKQEDIPNVDDVLMLRADAALAAGDHRRAAQILDAAELHAVSVVPAPGQSGHGRKGVCCCGGISEAGGTCFSRGDHSIAGKLLPGAGGFPLCL